MRLAGAVIEPDMTICSAFYRVTGLAFDMTKKYKASNKGNNYGCRG
jgi:hypothetical protein